jgi:hypothetical protein
MRNVFFGATLLVLCAGVAHPSVAQDQSRPSAMRTGIYRGHPVTYAIVNGKPIFEGDIILDHVQDLAPVQPPAKNFTTDSVGIAYPQYFWPKNSMGVAQIPHIGTSGATNLGAALKQFNATFTGIIQFVPRTTQADYVNFDFDPTNLSGTCESAVGRIGGEQITGGSIECNLGTLLHELGHVAGLFHEHSRPDRNSYVTINYANVIKGSGESRPADR